LERLRSEAADNHRLVDLLCGPVGVLKAPRPDLLETVAPELDNLKNSFAAVARAFRKILPEARLYDELDTSPESFDRRVVATETALLFDELHKALDAHDGNMQNLVTAIHRAWAEPGAGGSLTGAA
jgi:hypothetical protein